MSEESTDQMLISGHKQEGLITVGAIAKTVTTKNKKINLEVHRPQSDVWY